MSNSTLGENSAELPLEEARASYAQSLAQLVSQRHPDVYRSYDQLDEATERYKAAFAIELGAVALRGGAIDQETADEVTKRRELVLGRFEGDAFRTNPDLDTNFVILGVISAATSVATERYIGLVAAGVITSTAAWRARYKRRHIVRAPEFVDTPLVADAVANLNEGEATEEYCLQVMDATLHTERSSTVETTQQLKRVRSYSPANYLGLFVHRAQTRFRNRKS